MRPAWQALGGPVELDHADDPRPVTHGRHPDMRVAEPQHVRRWVLGMDREAVALARGHVTPDPEWPEQLLGPGARGDDGMAGFHHARAGRELDPWSRAAAPPGPACPSGNARLANSASRQGDPPAATDPAIGRPDGRTRTALRRRAPARARAAPAVPAIGSGAGQSPRRETASRDARDASASSRVECSMRNPSSCRSSMIPASTSSSTSPAVRRFSRSSSSQDRANRPSPELARNRAR